MKNVDTKRNVENGHQFDITKSPLWRAYVILGAHNPKELRERFLERDQKLMRSRRLHYKNRRLVVNRVKDILEDVRPATLKKEERDSRLDILWLWYHHAMQYAMWHYKDKATAQKFSSQALRYQTKDHPNKITRLLHYLFHDRLKDAEELMEKIRSDSEEKETAKSLLKFYKEEGF